VWNYWLGGRDYFAADRAAGDALDREFPHLAEIARAERAFLVRAVRFLAGPARIKQFLDVGAGLPAGGNTHEIAQRIAPDSGIVYADHDPAVLVHARALLRNPVLASTPEGVVSYVEADLRNVTAVLAGSAATLDHARPVALMLLGVLGHIDDDGAARSITSQLLDALPPGSYLVIADGVAASEEVSSAQRRYNQSAPVPYHLRTPGRLASFFDGLDLVAPGVVPCPRWKPDAPAGDEPPEAPAAYCGVARKP
jgi:O-methyltransferase involved in polyketide biosynthesis